MKSNSQIFQEFVNDFQIPMTGSAGSPFSLRPHLPGETPPFTYCVRHSLVLEGKDHNLMYIQSDLLSFSETCAGQPSIFAMQAQVVCGFTYRERLYQGKPACLRA